MNGKRKQKQVKKGENKTVKEEETEQANPWITQRSPRQASVHSQVEKVFFSKKEKNDVYKNRGTGQINGSSRQTEVKEKRMRNKRRKRKRIEDRRRRKKRMKDHREKDRQRKV